jgi:anaerobic magnesium-protoporphyrin IX monomethyl ester cyclase
VGISCHYQTSEKYALDLVRLVKNIDSEIVTVLGGLYVSLSHEEALIKCKELDFCISGEAERTFLSLIDEVRNGRKNYDGLQKIEGLSYRFEGIPKTVPKVNYIKNIDSIPKPARELIDLGYYMGGGKEIQLYGLGGGGKRSLSILTSRSCPYECSFCNMSAVHGPKFRHRSPMNVVDELEEMVNKYGAEHVFIMDDSFTFKRKRAKEICRQIIKRGLKFRWNTPNGISVRGMDQELAYLMKNSGCANVCVAVESGSDFIRNVVMNKNTKASEIKNSVECFNKANIPVVGFFLIGMPGESDDHFMQTYEMAKNLSLTSIVVSIAVPFVGTKLYEMCVNDGLIEMGQTFCQYGYNTPVIESNCFTREELVNRRRILLDLYPKLSILREIEESIHV